MVTEKVHYCEKILPALDRFQEAHYWIHMLEQHYHSADRFRWHLNAFLRALKEVNGILQTDLQNDPELVAWYREQRQQLTDDALLQLLSKKRDLIVHRSRLVPNSNCVLGLTDGRKLRFWLGFPIHPLEDSDSAMKRYIAFVREQGDTFGILTPDEDTIPCIQRQWKLPGLNDEIVSVCVSAWLKVANVMTATLRKLGEENEGFSLECRHDEYQYTTKMYDRQKLLDNVNYDGPGWLH